MKLSSRILQVAPSATLAISSKAKSFKQAGEDVVDFGAGEPDFDTPAYIKQAAIEAINSGFTKYTPSSGIAELRKKISEQFKQQGLNYAPEQIIVSCGAKHCLYNVIQVLCEAGDEVIIISPYWVSYVEMARLASAKPVVIKTSLEEGFKLNINALKSAITPNTRLLLLNSPSNPTGVIYTKSELQQIADICLEKKVLILSDEIYSEIVYDNNKHFSIGALNDEVLKNTITVNGVSKSFSMTGWRIGYLGAPVQIAKAVDNLQSHSTSNPASISQKAALAALSGGKDEVSNMRKAFEERRNYIVQRLDAIKGLRYFKPQGAFYVFCDISKFKINSNDLAVKLLEVEKVAVVPGDSFGHDDFIRISFATSMENIKKGLDRIERFLGKL